MNASEHVFVWVSGFVMTMCICLWLFGTGFSGIFGLGVVAVICICLYSAGCGFLYVNLCDCESKHVYIIHVQTQAL